jgi:nitronate monooxygenase
MGADFAYMGTRFIATHEAMAQDGFKQMIVDTDSSDIVYTPAISGVNANFLRPSIVAAGRDPDDLSVGAHSSLSLEGEAKVWKDIWSAGQGVGGIHDIVSTADLCARLTAEYRAAIARAAEELNQPTVPTA